MEAAAVTATAVTFLHCPKIDMDTPEIECQACLDNGTECLNYLTYMYGQPE